MVERLTGAARKAALRELHGWTEVDDRDAIRKVYHFGSFGEAWGFMNQVALLAARMEHPPEWFNLNNRVEVVLTTHDVAGVSDLDLRLARAIDEIAPARDRLRTP